MPIQIIRQDITKIKCDAIVNPTNESLIATGGTDAAIHGAAGPRLAEECLALGGVKIGEGKISGGYNLPCKYVIHTAAPVWFGGGQNEEESLGTCYKSALTLAKENGCESIAIPLIGTGACAFPEDRVLRIAIGVISEFLLDNEMLVYIVVYDKGAYRVSEKLFGSIKEYIDDNYVREQAEYLCEAISLSCDEERGRASYNRAYSARKKAAAPEQSLEDMLKGIDDSFSVTLLKLIDKKGISEVECYKRSNVSKKTFWKIVNQRGYRPSRNTVLAFAIGLRLTLQETERLLATVGFALSRSSKFDIIVEYFITRGIYNIYEINEALFQFDQELLGSV